MDQPKRTSPPRRLVWRLLLLIPVLAVLAVPVFNRAGPALWGFPFFYWYQMLWVILCSAAAGAVFLIESARDQSGDDA
jgi:Protein of unknown function (DUF3311)